ncbi:MAG TPA: DUF1579 family protein [Thermoanaerobaculia bacterium]|nr:DUF1579 family protein [Thermoanaerobaculia bacterium]
MMIEIPIGEWRGTARTWLEPGAAPAVNDFAATTTRVLEGKTTLIGYRSHVKEHRSDGMMIVGTDIGTKRLSLTWVDTFHTGGNVMPFGADEAGVLRGSFAAGEELWHWRIAITVSEDELRFDHTMIEPSGEETPAIEVILRRESATAAIH